MTWYDYGNLVQYLQADYIHAVMFYPLTMDPEEIEYHVNVESLPCPT